MKFSVFLKQIDGGKWKASVADEKGIVIRLKYFVNKKAAENWLGATKRILQREARD